MKGNVLKNRKILLRVISALVLALVIGLIGYKNFEDRLITQTVYEMEAYEGIGTKILFVRNEKPLDSSTGKNLVFVASQADKLAKGDKYALSFENSDEALKYFEKERLKKELERYKTLNNSSKVGAIKVATAERVVDESFIDLLIDFNNHDNSLLDSRIDDFRDKLIFFQNSISNEKKDFSSKIETINSEIASLDRSGIPKYSYFTDSAGYFSRYSDGHENLVNFENVNQLTCTEFERLISDIDSKPSSDKGKIVSDYTYYALAVLENKDLLRMKLPIEGEDLSLNGFELAFGQNDSYRVDAEVVAINSCGNKGLVVFKCKGLNESVIDLRLEDSTICFNQQTGLKVSKEALRFDDDNNPGVYIKSLNVIKFVKINILGEFKDQLIVSKYTPVKKDKNDKTTEATVDIATTDGETETSAEKKSERILEIYDEVVIDGKGLYARKHN